MGPLLRMGFKSPVAVNLTSDIMSSLETDPTLRTAQATMMRLVA